jgi:hypothetical protein
MQKAYIILAHKDLDHLTRLIERLDDGHSHFFIHIDLKTPLPVTYAEVAKRQDVSLVKRIATKWGGFSLAEATLNAMKELRDSGLHFDAISLLSGQDYPIKSNTEIDEFLSSSYHSVFLDYFPLPNYDRWKAGGTYRYKKYFFGTTSVPLFFSRAANLLSTLIPIFARKLPQNLKPYCGSQWWTIDMYALNYVLDYIEEHPKYLSFHKFTFAPDELFFHIIWLNAKDERIKSSITNNNLRFLKWIKLDNPHPEILTKEDFDDICNSPALFARKFDSSADQEILNLIDDRILCRVV